MPPNPTPTPSPASRPQVPAAYAAAAIALREVPFVQTVQVADDGTGKPRLSITLTHDIKARVTVVQTRGGKWLARANDKSESEQDSPDVALAEAVAGLGGVAKARAFAFLGV